ATARRSPRGDFPPAAPVLPALHPPRLKPSQPIMTVAEVISIGDELTSGQRLDTNSQWFSQQLSDLGIQVMYHTTVADDLAASQAVFRAAVDRADVVVTSGGLGPTADDLTRDVMAGLLGTELVLHEESLEHI